MSFLSFLGGVTLFPNIAGRGPLRLTTLLLRVESDEDLLFLKMQCSVGASGESCMFARPGAQRMNVLSQRIPRAGPGPFQMASTSAGSREMAVRVHLGREFFD